MEDKDPKETKILNYLEGWRWKPDPILVGLFDKESKHLL